MSQVIVEEDNLKDRRDLTRGQELKIDTEGVHKKWLKTGTYGLDIIAKLAGIMFLPVVLFWSFLAALMGICISLVGGVFRALAGFPKEPTPRSKLK